MRWARFVWPAPWSALGLFLSFFFRSRRVTRGVVLAEGAQWPRRFGWKYRAITFGHVVLCIDEADDDLMTHELVHVRQYERWGPLFIPVYLGACLTARMRGGRAYADNRFEVAARATEGSETRT